MITLGYTKAMLAVQRRLREIGLPDTMFDADFPEQLEAAKERYTRISARYAEMREAEAFKDLPMPYESLNVDSLEMLCLVQGRRPKFVNEMKRINKVFRNEGGHSLSAEAKRIAVSKRLPKAGTKTSRLFHSRGWDMEKLITEGVEAARPPKKK